MSRVDGSKCGGGPPIFMSFAPMDRMRLPNPKTAKAAKVTLALLHLGVIAYYCIARWVTLLLQSRRRLVQSSVPGRESAARICKMHTRAQAAVLST